VLLLPSKLPLKLVHVDESSRKKCHHFTRHRSECRIEKEARGDATQDSCDTVEEPCERPRNASANPIPAVAHPKLVLLEDCAESLQEHMEENATMDSNGFCVRRALASDMSKREFKVALMMPCLANTMLCFLTRVPHN
jgi:hypothetical protein